MINVVAARKKKTLLFVCGGLCDLPKILQDNLFYFAIVNKEHSTSGSDHFPHFTRSPTLVVENYFKPQTNKSFSILIN